MIRLPGFVVNSYSFIGDFGMYGSPCDKENFSTELRHFVNKRGTFRRFFLSRNYSTGVVGLFRRILSVSLRLDIGGGPGHDPGNECVVLFICDEIPLLVAKIFHSFVNLNQKISPNPNNTPVSSFLNRSTETGIKACNKAKSYLLLTVDSIVLLHTINVVEKQQRTL